MQYAALAIQSKWQEGIVKLAQQNGMKLFLHSTSNLIKLPLLNCFFDTVLLNGCFLVFVAAVDSKALTASASD